MKKLDEPQLFSLVNQATEGDRDALETLLKEVTGNVYGLALRMLWNPSDAEDATQDILVKIATRLASFDLRASLHTWVYRIAANHLIDVRRSALERHRINAEQFSEQLEAGQAPFPQEHAGTKARLTEEIRIGCTMALLQCLDRPHRLTYILAEIFDFSGPDAALALEVSEATFRKRLSRARKEVENFTAQHCGIVNPDAGCVCERRVVPAISCGLLDPKRLLFARDQSAVDSNAVHQVVSLLSRAHRTLEIYRSQPDPVPETNIARSVVASLVATGPAESRDNQLDPTLN